MSRLLSRLLRHGPDLLHIKAPVLGGGDVFQIIAPLNDAANIRLAAFIRPLSENAIFLAPCSRLGRKRKTVLLPCVDNTVSGAGAVFVSGEKVSVIKFRLPDVKPPGTWPNTNIISVTRSLAPRPRAVGDAAGE